MTVSTKLTYKHYQQALAGLSSIHRIYVRLSPKWQRERADELATIQDICHAWMDWVRENIGVNPPRMYSAGLNMTPHTYLIFNDIIEKGRQIYRSNTETRQKELANDWRKFLTMATYARDLSIKLAGKS